MPDVGTGLKPKPFGLDQMAEGIARDEELYARRASDLAGRQEKIAAGREETLAPMEQKISAQIAEPYPERTKVDIPQFKSQPIIDSKDYEQLSYGLIAMAMIGGIASKGRWLEVGDALNGALSGYLKGNVQVAQKRYKDYEEGFKGAMAKEEQANREFSDILKNKQMRIQDQINQYRIVAAKYDRQDALVAAQSRSLDRMWQSLESRKSAMTRLQESHDRAKEMMGLRWQMHQDSMNMRQSMLDARTGAGSPPTPELMKSWGAMVATGMPVSQVVPGWGGQGVANRKIAQQAAIEHIMQTEKVDAGRAGELLAQRQLGFAGIKGSVVQLEKIKGATVAAVEQLEFNVGKTTEAIDKLEKVGLGSSDLSPVLNSIIRGEQKWTGAPEYAELFFYMSAAGKEAARLQAGGQASIAQLYEGARKEAQEWASAGFTTPAMWKKGVAPAMIAEGKNRLENFDTAIRAQLGSVGSGKRDTDKPAKAVVPATEGKIKFLGFE